MRELECVSTRRTEEADRRAAERDRLGQLLEVRWPYGAGAESTTGILRDFSLNGLLFVCGTSLRPSLQPGTDVVCRFRTPPHLPSIGGRTLTCEGRVSRIDPMPEQVHQISIAVAVNSISVV